MCVCVCVRARARGVGGGVHVHTHSTSEEGVRVFGESRRHGTKHMCTKQVDAFGSYLTPHALVYHTQHAPFLLLLEIGGILQRWFSSVYLWQGVFVNHGNRSHCFIRGRS
jgi:hypothetical protein